MLIKKYPIKQVDVPFRWFDCSFSGKPFLSYSARFHEPMACAEGSYDWQNKGANWYSTRWKAGSTRDVPSTIQARKWHSNEPCHEHAQTCMSKVICLSVDWKMLRILFVAEPSYKLSCQPWMLSQLKLLIELRFKIYCRSAH